MLVLGCVLLIPWLFFATVGAGMPFEGRDAAEAYTFVSAVWTCPILLTTSFVYKRKNPSLVCSDC